MKHIILPLSSLIVISICCMPSKTKTQKVHFDNADIIFVDPCYFAKDDGVWEEYCEDFAQNKNLDKLGCEQSICISVGDVSPDVLVDEGDGSVLGSICTDSYVLGCFKLEDVLKYNPEYAEGMEKYPDSFTVIKGFTGDVVFETKKERYYDKVLPITTIIGVGTIRFLPGFTNDDGSIKLRLS